MRKAILISAALILIPALGQAKTLDDLLAERGVVAKSESGSKAMMAGSKVYYKDGTTFEFPDNGFTTRINTVVQPRYEFSDNDTGVDNTSSFSVERARLLVTGTALNQEFSYGIQAAFDNGNGAGVEATGAGSGTLLDAFIKWHACDWVYVKLGQYKTHISRQYVTNGTQLQFADRSNVSDYFTIGRANGASVGGQFDGFEWDAMITNGSSLGEGINAEGNDTDHGVIFGARYNHGDIDAYEEGDVHGTEDLAASIGVHYGIESNDLDLGDDLDIDVLNVDLTIKHQGMSVAAEYFHREFDGAGIDLDEDGFYVQAGYFITPGELEIAARYGLVEYDDADPSGVDEESEVAVSVNYYWWAHHLKAQIGWFRDTVDLVDGSETDSNRWLVQLSAWF